MRFFDVIYFVGKYLAFPGSYLRAFWEQISCRIFMIPVTDVNYLSTDENCSHVEHEFPDNAIRAFFVAFGPGFMNFIMGIVLFLCGTVSVYLLGLTPSDSALRYVLMVAAAYVGASMLCNCFPSVEDAMYFWEKLLSKESSLLSKIILFIPAVLMRLGSYLERYSVTVLIFIGVGIKLIVFTLVK